MNAQRFPLPPRSACVLAACVLLVLAFAPAQYFGRQQDDLLYFIGARALTMGRYCLLTSPGCPPLTLINPGWPAMLAPLFLLTERPGPFQAFSALILAAAPVAVWAWLRRREDETTALLAAALFASCPLALSQSGVVMTEAPYLLFFLAMLACVEKRRASAAGAWGAALLLTRTSGLAVMPALLLPFARARRWKDAARAAAAPILASALWAAWSWSKSRTVGKFDLLPATYGAGGWAKPFAVAAANARFYAAEWGGCFLPPALAEGAPAMILGAALAVASAWGVARALRRRADDPAAWALLGTAALLAVWGWQYERYMIPLLPLLLWALASGLGRAAKPALAVLLALQLGAQTLPRLGRPSPWGRPELARTYAWLARQPAPNLLTSTEPVRDGWLSGLPNTPVPDAARDEDFAPALKAAGVRYVLRADGQDYGLEHDESSAVRRGVERMYRRLEDPRRFRKVHEEPDERAAIYEPL
ncbi:MAG: hypothetical protein ACHQ2Z_02900 [Elusimicrobiota bacterium]